MKPRAACNLRRVEWNNINSFAVISDVHLDHPKSLLTQKFIHGLENLKDVEAVLFLGDIFDFIFAKQKYYAQKWKNVFDAIEALRIRGIKTVFIEGNHDFGFEYLTHKDILHSFDACGDIELIASHPTLGKVMFRHGDDIVCPPSYRIFRNFVKSSFHQFSASVIPSKLVDKICEKWAHHSRSQDRYSQLSHSFLEGCLARFLNSLPPEYLPKVLVIGHVHLDFDRTIEKTRVLIGPDWLQTPSILVCDKGGKFTRRFF